MKIKQILLMLFVFLTSITFYTQALPGLSLDMGINLSDMDMKGFKSQLENKISELEILDHSKLLGPKVGINLKYKLFPTISLRTGAALSMRGVKVKYGIKSGADTSQISSSTISSSFLDILNSANADYNFNLSYRFLYLDIPVLAQVKLPVPIISPAFFAGINAGVLLKESMPSELDYLDDLKKVDLSGLFGVSMKAPLVNLPLPIIPELHIVLSHQMNLSSSIKDSNASITTLGLELQVF